VVPISELLAPLYRAFDRRLLYDAGLVATIASLLGGIHLFVPSGQRAQFVFNHETLAPWTLWTNAFVHAGWSHLLQNVAGFLLAAGAAYILCRLLSARKWFWVTTAAFLIVLPTLVSLSSYFVVGWIAPDASPMERGFSGVAAGYVSFLFVTFLVWFVKRTSGQVAQYVGQAVILLLVFELSVIYIGLDVFVVGLVAVGIGLSVWGLGYELAAIQWRPQALGTAVAVGVPLMLAWFVLILFPAEWTSGGQTTNIFAHGAGLLWGGCIAGGVRLRRHSPVERW